MVSGEENEGALEALENLLGRLPEKAAPLAARYRQLRELLKEVEVKADARNAAQSQRKTIEIAQQRGLGTAIPPIPHSSIAKPPNKACKNLIHSGVVGGGVSALGPYFS